MGGEGGKGRHIVLSQVLRVDFLRRFSKEIAPQMNGTVGKLNKNVYFIVYPFCYLNFSPGIADKISQMPIVLIPVHFDRDPIDHIPSCQRSVVIRTFITSDFMTGVPATPGKQIPIEVRISLYREPPKQA